MVCTFHDLTYFVVCSLQQRLLQEPCAPLAIMSLQSGLGLVTVRTLQILVFPTTIYVNMSLLDFSMAWETNIDSTPEHELGLSL